MTSRFIVSSTPILQEFEAFQTRMLRRSITQMLECRRCPTRVVATANSLISHNKDRDARQLLPRAENGEGDVRILQYASLANETVGIASIVTQLINEGGYKPKDILVLAQRRSVGNPIHDALEGRSIPSKSYYHEGALDSAPAQEKMAMLKLMINEEDRIALRWLLGVGSNDFRKNAYARIRNYCEDSNKSPWDLMCELEARKIQIPHTGILINRFREIKSQLEALRGAADMAEFVEKWLSGQLEETDRFRALVSEIAPSVGSFD
jgi:ATP-dependent DNA helicase UvrD/PcrA